MAAVKDTIAKKKVENFLNANYSCECGDPKCYGSAMEADMIVEMVKKVYEIN